MEIVAVIGTVLLCIFRKQSYEDICLKALQNGTTLYIPLAVIWVLLFMEQKGAVTCLYTNKWLTKLGNMSNYLFLIHYVVINYTIGFIDVLNITFSPRWQVALVVFELAMSILVAYVYSILKNIVDNLIAEEK